MEVLALPVNEADGRWVAAWSEALDTEDLARADRFRRAADRVHFIAARALLRTALGYAAGRSPASLVLARGQYGKPFLPDAPALHFSLTHTAGMTAIALHSSDVGCDVERLDRTVADTVFRMMAPEERSWLEAQRAGPARQESFIRLWVVKEAFAKALGLGLALDPRSYAFELSDSGARLSRVPGTYSDGGWRISSRLAGPAHILAVAARGQLDFTEQPSLRLVSAESVARAATLDAHRPSTWEACVA